MSETELNILEECVREDEFSLLKLLCMSISNTGKEASNERFLKMCELAGVKNDTSITVINPSSKLRILMYCNWCSSKDLCDVWNKMSKGDYSWNNIKIVWEEPCDYYCVVNKPPTGIKTDPSKTILLRMEPNMEKHPNKWGEWANPPEKDFLFYSYNSLQFSNVEWHLSKSYEQFKTENIVKDANVLNILSTVLSTKYSDSGHQKRVNFVKFLESKGMDVDVYGQNGFMWKRYKGSLPYHQKDNALFPYKYTFNCENHEIKNYCTEKLYDGILAECLTFYSGCFNSRDFVDESAFVYLELSNFEKDYNTIKKAIEEDLWKQRLPFIKEAKKKILEEMQFFPRISKIITTKKNEM
jgi:hypothetical protein